MDTEGSELEDIYTMYADGYCGDRSEYMLLLPSGRTGRNTRPVRGYLSGWASGNCGRVLPVVMVGFGVAVLLGVAAIGLALISLSPGDTPNVTTRDLNGNWRLTNSNGTIQINAQVPGSVHSALLRAHIIPDPYFGNNDVTVRWVSQEQWVFERHFTVRKNMSRFVHLVCEGLDTIGTISVNGVIVGHANNQFLRYIYDVTSHVKPGQMNTITIAFASPVQFAATESAHSHPPVLPACPALEFRPECHGNMIRKSQGSFGSRWSPALPTQGIWRDIYIVEFQFCRILDLLTRSPFKESDSDVWDFGVTTYVHCNVTEPTNVTFTWQLLDEQNNTIGRLNKSDVMLTTGEHSVSALMRNLKVDLWWPVRQGKQKLYWLNTTMAINGTVTDMKSVRTGFRTVTLVQEPLSTGLSFYFEVNGREMFLRGSTWVPPDMLYESVYKKRVKSLMRSAVDANMTVLRVPGDAVYESDYFYGLADEYGLLIWQDFMFSSALYPGTEDFEQLVAEEVNYQLRRLVHHPCIVVWAGSDQVERAIFEKWYNMSGPYYHKYKEDYRRLYDDVIKPEVQRVTSVPFVTSSPSNGKLSVESDGISESVDPNSSEYGDIYSYQFLKDCLDHKTTVTGRFVSQYGWQSWPSYAALQQVATPSDLTYGSPFFHYRQRHPEAGNGTDQMIHRHFNWTAQPTEKGFRQYIYLTQLMQALCVKAETEYYRIMRASDVQTMGAISWQLNDLWPAPSGATLEQDGTWKMAHNYLGKALSDVHLVVHRDGNNAIGYIINDTPMDLIGYKADLTIYKWDQGTIYTNGLQMGVDVIKAQRVSKIFEQVIDDDAWINSMVCPTMEWCYLNFQVWRSDPRDTSIPVAMLYPYSFSKSKGVTHPNIRLWSVTATGEKNVFLIKVWCDEGAPFFWAEAETIRGWFSNNGDTLMCSYGWDQMHFHSWDDGVTNKTLSEALSFTSLADVLKPRA